MDHTAHCSSLKRLRTAHAYCLCGIWVLISSIYEWALGQLALEVIVSLSVSPIMEIIRKPGGVCATTTLSDSQIAAGIAFLPILSPKIWGWIRNCVFCACILIFSQYFYDLVLNTSFKRKINSKSGAIWIFDPGNQGPVSWLSGGELFSSFLAKQALVLSKRFCVWW